MSSTNIEFSCLFQGFVPLYQSYESFYTRNMYTRVRDIFNRPIASVPGAYFELNERVSDDYNWTYRYYSIDSFLTVFSSFSCSICSKKRYTGKTIKTINLGSYNYLGFAEKAGPCAQDAINGIKTFGVANCNTRVELGRKSLLYY
jgi:serine palmitoyltransferase